MFRSIVLTSYSSAGSPIRVSSTACDCTARNLTAHGGVQPVAAMLQKLALQQLVEHSLAVKRKKRSMPIFGFIPAMVLACHVGVSRLNRPGFLKREPLLTGILR